MPKETNSRPDKYEPIREAVRELPDFEIQAILDARKGVRQEPGPIQLPSEEGYVRIQTAALERLRRLEAGNYKPEVPSEG